MARSFPVHTEQTPYTDFCFILSRPRNSGDICGCRKVVLFLRYNVYLCPLPLVDEVFTLQLCWADDTVTMFGCNGNAVAYSCSRFRPTDSSYKLK